jgi:hypothetical protein
MTQQASRVVSFLWLMFIVWLVLFLLPLSQRSSRGQCLACGSSSRNQDQKALLRIRLHLPFLLNRPVDLVEGREKAALTYLLRTQVARLLVRNLLRKPLSSGLQLLPENRPWHTARRTAQQS